MTEKKKAKENPIEIKQIGQRLRSIRKGLGFGNADDFANFHGLNRSQYGKYETGSEDFQISSLIKILKKLDISLTAFFNEDFDEMNRENNRK